MKECTNSGWSVRELERQTASLLFERLALSKNKKQVLTLSQKGHEISQPSDLVKDPDVLEFLGLKKESVFYNRIAKSFVLIDLKLGKLTHQHIGQMQMYLNYYKRTEKIQGENDPIGILLCSDKNDSVVEFTLPEGKQEIFASKYKLTLPSKKELKVEIQKERKLLENYSRKVSK